MFNNANVPSLSDIAAVTNNDGFGGNNGWWILIILFALFGGWGNGGYGNGANAAGGYVLASDFANLERKIDGVNTGLCDGFYAMNTGMLNGFNGVATGIAGIGTNVMQAVNTLQAGQTALATQLQQCCCDNRESISQVRNEMTRAAQDIMLNCNANYRSLHDELVAFQMSAKDEKIAELTAKLTRCDTERINENQSAYLLNKLSPVPQPAYIVPSPYTGYNPCCGQCC